MDELVIDNLVYIPSKKAAAITGYAKDYIGQLCREGRIEAKLVGRSWYVLESSVKEHRFGRGEIGGEQTTTPVEPVSVPVVAQEPIESIEEVSVVPEPASTWESPTYVPEPVEEILPSRLPTSLENTGNFEKAELPSQIEEVQNAWQEWFSRNEGVAPSSSPVEPSTEPSFEAVVPAQDEDRDEVVEAVPVTIHKTRTIGGSMDIGQREPVRSRFSIRNQSRVRKETRRTAAEGVKGSRVVLQAAFVALIVITAAITIIGTGTLDVFSPSWAGTSPAIDFLAGVRSIEK